jgi:hypothetical protein
VPNKNVGNDEISDVYEEISEEELESVRGGTDYIHMAAPLPPSLGRFIMGGRGGNVPHPGQIRAVFLDPVNR